MLFFLAPCAIEASTVQLAHEISSFLHFGSTSYVALTTRLGIGRFFPTLAVSALVKPSRHRSACSWDLRFLALLVDIICRPNNPIRHRSFLCQHSSLLGHRSFILLGETSAVLTSMEWPLHFLFSFELSLFE